MEAQVFTWRERAKGKTLTHDEWEAFHVAAIQEEGRKRCLEKINSLLNKLPVRFRNKTFDDFCVHYPEQRRVKIIAERFVATFADRLRNGTCIQFLGNPGTGKTLLSLILYQYIARAGHSVHYEPSIQFLKTVQEKRYESNTAYQNILEYYRHIDFLVLDEITESVSKDGCPSKWEQQLLFSLIDARYQEKRCTLIISNKDIDGLISRLGNPIVDRLSEGGIVLIFNWKSYRQNKGLYSL